MRKEDLGDLAVFLVASEEANFTRAAARLGVSQSAVSHTIRRLEASIGIKLMNRTSRRISLTDAGEKLLSTLRPGMEQIDARIEELRSLGDAPRGLVRLTASKPIAKTLLWPVLSEIARDYPEIEIELNLDSRLNDLTEDRFDAGVRLGEFVARDMISVRISPPVRIAAVASPGYLKDREPPEHPRDLASHICINHRFGPNAAIYEWEFEKDQEELVVRVSGSFVFNDSDMAIRAAKEGHGIAYVTETEVRDELRTGSLVRLLDDWCPPFEGYHLFYSSRRQMSSALRLLIDRLKAQSTVLMRQQSWEMPTNE
ncbi:LysR family transcriptional regulator [Cohaesibacter haloalkalitolerans]|uniref:LysR family transcriptional regulator n=1 Tax=Cohaesibacter haloalkalitolerans TaxID=1162980 RepID=UPI000E6527F3|nr:LysR family transcriptional regulator [Cohaesibacter haloalkalitolerans]